MSHSHSHHTNTAPQAAAPSAAPTAPTHEAIAHRAYDIYVKSGSTKGHCKQNWQQAEQSFCGEGHGQSPAAAPAAKSAR